MAKPVIVGSVQLPAGVTPAVLTDPAAIAQLLRPGPVGPIDAKPDKDTFKKDCSTALKILKQFERLAQKYGIKLSPSRLE